jgi:hypothetical protein
MPAQKIEIMLTLLVDVPEGVTLTDQDVAAAFDAGVRECHRQHSPDHPLLKTDPALPKKPD